MRSARGLRTFAPAALSLFLLAGLPGLALASGPDVNPATSPPVISGTVTALVGGTPLAGIDVSANGTFPGDYASAQTDADGNYVLEIGGADTYELTFTDPTPTYLYGTYDTSQAGNLNIGSSGHTGVDMGTGDVTVNVQMTVGKRITGTVTGPAIPPNPLVGVLVQADAGDYITFVTTLTDGTFTMAVPSGAFRIDFGLGQGFYVQGCWFDGAMVTSPNNGCDGALTVGSSNVSGINAHLAFEPDVLINLTPDGNTVAAGAGQTFSASLAGGAAYKVRAAVSPSKKGLSDISGVTAYVTFSMTGGTCTGAVCTPSIAGDHTVTATYGAMTGTADLISDPGNYPTAAPTAVPTAGPTAGTTPAPTSTGGSGDTDGDGGLLLTMLLFGMATVAATGFVLRRRSLLHS